jgi:hypothetical protein
MIINYLGFRDVKGVGSGDVEVGSDGVMVGGMRGSDDGCVN